MGLSPTVFEKMANSWFQQQVSELNKQAGDPQDVMKLAITPKSTGKKENYAWLGSLPLVRKWIGDKQARRLADHGYSLQNEPFEASFVVDRNDLRDEQVGGYEYAVRDLPLRLEQYKRRMIVDLITGGTSGLAYDGVAFFANASGVRVIDNLGAGTGIDTLAHIMADIDSVIQAMAGFKDADGEYMNIIPDTFLVPPAAKRLFDTACYSPGDASSASPNAKNPFLNYGFTVIADARITGTDANDWYAFCTKGILKPFIEQEREGIRNVMDDGAVKRNRDIVYSVEWDGQAGYGLPHLAYKVVNT